jgi:hypothetical protein
MDPSAAEEDSEDGSLIVSYMPSLNEVTHILQNGSTESPIASKVRIKRMANFTGLIAYMLFFFTTGS